MGSIYTLVLLFAAGSSFAPVVLPDHDKFGSYELCMSAGDAALHARFVMKPTYPTAPIVGYACFERQR